MANVFADVPVRLEFSAPVDRPGACTLKREIELRGKRVKDPSSGEKALLFRVTVSKKSDGGVAGELVVIKPDDTPGCNRKIERGKTSCYDFIKETLASIVTFVLDDKIGAAEIVGSQAHHYNRSLYIIIKTHAAVAAGVGRADDTL